jgi:cell division protein FtsB
MADNSRLFDPRGYGSPQPKGQFWRVLQPWVYALVGLLGVAVVLALFYPAWKRGERLKDQAEHLQNEMHRKKQELTDLQEMAGQLKDDPFTVERVSRDTLNVARPGEVIFKFPPYTTNPAGPGEGKRPTGTTEASQKP